MKNKHKKNHGTIFYMYNTKPLYPEVNIYMKKQNSLIVKVCECLCLKRNNYINNREEISQHSFADKRMSKQSATFCHRAYLAANVRENEVEACTRTLMKNGRLTR